MSETRINDQNYLEASLSSDVGQLVDLKFVFIEETEPLNRKYIQKIERADSDSFRS